MAFDCTCLRFFGSCLAGNSRKHDSSNLHANLWAKLMRCIGPPNRAKQFSRRLYINALCE